MRVLAFTAVWLVLSAASLYGQEAEHREPLVSRPSVDQGQLLERQKAIKAWVEKYQDYKEWERRWRNRIYPYKRKTPPVPPQGLEQDCQNLDLQDLFLADDSSDRDHFIFPDEPVAKQDTFQTACLLLRQSKEDYETARIRQEILALRIKADKPAKHTVLFERIHIGGLWQATTVGSPVRAMLESHVTFSIGGRLQLFAAPGMMLVCMQGFHDCGFGYDWGLSVRLLNFRFPMLDRPASLHINLAKVWVTSRSVPGLGTNLDIAGFSVTFRRKP